MKRKSSPALLFLLCFWSVSLNAQSVLNPSNDAIQNPVIVNDAAHSCISPQEYQLLEKQVQDNIRWLGLDKNLNKTTSTTSLIWPIRAAAGFTDCDYYFLAAYVDQDTLTGTFKDFACGTNTYDGHHGTDIAEWPYGFYKMDNSLVEVVAAAAGTIVQKADGNFDRNCSSNNLTANSIIIQHADGSCALYWHMKKNSVTSKTTGQTVAAGEYLGVVGSSGSASGPHLHFEVWSGSTNTTYKDPFSGTCNTLNATSWWTNQKPHTNPAVIKVSVNTTDLVLPGCPTTETPNEADTFAIPFQGAGLGPGYAKFYIFIRDDVSGMTADCKILNPNSSVFNSWTYTASADSKTHIQGYSKLLPTVSGKYTFQATYNGQTCAKNFYIVQATGISSPSTPGNFLVTQNAVNATVTLTSENMENGTCRLTIVDLTGQVVMAEEIKIANRSIHKDFSIAEFPSGIYFISVDVGEKRFVRKIVKTN